MAQSIREMISEKSLALRTVEDLGPAKASEELVALSSLLASLNAYIAEKKYWYNIKRMECRKEHKSAADAKIYAEASTEWKDWNDAELQKDALKDLIGSVKYYLKAAGEEQKISRF